MNNRRLDGGLSLEPMTCPYENDIQSTVDVSSSTTGVFLTFFGLGDAESDSDDEDPDDPDELTADDEELLRRSDLALRFDFISSSNFACGVFVEAISDFASNLTSLAIRGAISIFFSAGGAIGDLKKLNNVPCFLGASLFVIVRKFYIRAD